MSRENCLEESSVIGETEVEQFVDDDEVLKPGILFPQVGRERDRPRGRTGAPFPGHSLDAHLPGLDVEALRPCCDPRQHRGAFGT